MHEENKVQIIIEIFYMPQIQKLVEQKFKKWIREMDTVPGDHF